MEKVDLGDHTAFVGLIVDSALGDKQAPTLRDNQAPLHISYFLKNAPKIWLVRLALTTAKSRNEVRGSMEEYAEKKILVRSK